METLKEKLENFAFIGNKVEDLTKEFSKLAPYFLYGGYVRVLDRYCVYINKVEFYFHSELPGGIKDEIVYHRNYYHIDGELPYFEPITFHAHASGYDIAFEKKDQFRASALIREYIIYDKQLEKFLKVVNSLFVKGEDGRFKKVEKIDSEDSIIPCIKSRFEYVDEPCINKQSTYLYDLLNGFGDSKNVCWFPETLPNIDYAAKAIHLEPQKRKGVYAKDRWPEEEYKEPRERKWSFERKEFILIED